MAQLQVSSSRGGVGETGKGPTYGEGHESVILLELPVLIQEVLRVKDMRPSKMLGVPQHRAQQRKHLRPLDTEKDKSVGVI